MTWAAFGYFVATGGRELQSVTLFQSYVPLIVFLLLFCIYIFFTLHNSVNVHIFMHFYRYMYSVSMKCHSQELFIVPPY